MSEKSQNTYGGQALIEGVMIRGKKTAVLSVRSPEGEIIRKEVKFSRFYNPKLLNEKKHFYLSLPFFLILMVLLAGIFTLNSNEKKQNTYYLLLSIVICVIIFYFKNFSTALGVTERIPMIISVWSPIIILSIFCSIGVMQINEK